MWVYLLIAAMLAIAIAVQVAFLRANAGQATGTVKVITSVNIGMLSLLMLAILWFGYTRAVK